MKTTEEIVQEHKKMVLMTGNLSDFHLKNMKIWPTIIFDDLSDVKITYDFTRQNEDDEEELHAGCVSYDFYFAKEPTDSKELLKRKIESLIGWTKNLFWDDTVVEIKKKGKKWVSWKK